MAIVINKAAGSGGNPPTKITIEGIADGCDQVYATVSCGGEPPREPPHRIDTSGLGVWTATFENDQGCKCGETVLITVSCFETMVEAVEANLVLVCDPPPCCERVTVNIDTKPLPCLRAGGEVVVRFSAALLPNACDASFEWNVKDSAKALASAAFTPGGWTFVHSFNKAGAYEVTVRAIQDDRCNNPVLTAAVNVTIDPCSDSGCIGGSFVDNCRIDLPKNDVVEAIDFERFFRLSGVKFGDLLEVTPEIPVDKPEGPGILNIPEMRLALFLPFRQEWKLCGYCRGRIVNSFTLGPEEEQTIDIFKWDRTTRNLESNISFESEQSTESSSTRRDTNDVATDIATQAGFETNSQGKVGFQVGVVDVGLAAGFTARAGVNDAEKSTRASIVDATSRSTGRVRTSRTLKVVEGREYGQEMRITRRLRNANKCHTLTIAFFEILANYGVSTFVRTDKVRLVVLVDSLSLIALASFSREAVRVHEKSLRLVLLDSSLADGFAAARFLDARARACTVLCQGCSCGDEHGQVEGLQWNNLTTAANALGSIVSSLRAMSGGVDALFTASVPPLGALAPIPPPAQAVLATNVKRYLFFKSLRTHAPTFLASLAGLGFGGGAGSVTVAQVEATAQLLGALPPEVIAKLIYDDPNSKNVGTEAWTILVGVGNDPIIAANIALAAFWARVSGTYDDGGLVAALNAFRAAYADWQKIKQAQLEKDEKAAAIQKIEQAEREARVLEAYPLRETADASERLDALLAHLNDPRNLDHYRFAVWNERSGATDATLIGLALAGLVDPTPVGMVGDQLAVPVKMKTGSKLEQFFRESIKDLVEQFTRTEVEHILPTPALYAEAIVGTCCSCEDNIERQTELDFTRMGLENRILELETERLRARLDKNPAQLDRESPPPAIRVAIDKSGTSA